SARRRPAGNNEVWANTSDSGWRRHYTETAPRGEGGARRAPPFSGAFRRISKGCGAIPGRFAFGLSSVDRRRQAAGLAVDGPGGAPFPGADSIFSSLCGAVSGRLATA